jgi:hypothetical protein
VSAKKFVFFACFYRVLLKRILAAGGIISKKEIAVREYHHLGIPTKIKHKNEMYLEKYKCYHTNFDDNPYGIEWMRYEEGCPLPELVKTVPHVAFKVDNLEAELEGKEILIEPNSPSEGVRVAFIVHNGAPIEFLEYTKQK